jgi:hypothetical protein
MHEEICTLKEQLLEAASHSCKEAQGCKFVVK